MSTTQSAALVCAAPPGVGGLGHHSGHVLGSLAPLFAELTVFAPGTSSSISQHAGLHLQQWPPLVPDWQRRYSWLRYLTGRYQATVDRAVGAWIASRFAEGHFRFGYFLTEIALESLRIAKTSGTRTILDNPTGHVRAFHAALDTESRRWTGWPFLGHPGAAMVERVESEYALADRIRVSSAWAKRSLVEHGVPADKVLVVPQTIDIRRFTPVATPNEAGGPLRVVFVGSFSVGKGFQYLFDAIRAVGASRVQLEMVGATGDPWSRRLFARLKQGLDIRHAPGDPLPAYQRAELFVLPTLHDGFGLVVGEAMACGLPVIATTACGAAEWIEPGQSGWVVPPGSVDALAAALDNALSNRRALGDMGRLGRQLAESQNDAVHLGALRTAVQREWLI